MPAAVLARDIRETHSFNEGVLQAWRESGRGLHVVSSLCDEWGCTPPGPRGKVVWAMFATGASW